MMKKMNKMKKILSLVLINLILLSNFAQAADLDYVWKNYTKDRNSQLDIFVDGSKIYVATNGGLLISVDGGATWITKTTADGLGNNIVRGVYAAGSNIYAATRDGLSISNDGGVTWTTKTTVNGLAGNNVSAVYVSGSSIYTGAHDATRSYLAISNDGGMTWTTLRNFGTNRSVHDIYVSGSNIYVATQNGLGISTDGGMTWAIKTTANGLANNIVTGVYAEGSTIYAATFYGGLSRSTDGGLSWSIFSGLGQQACCVYVSGSNIYVGTALNGVAISTDGGGTWTNKTTADGLGNEGVKGVYVSGSNIYAATYGGLSISIDGGTTWKNTVWDLISNDVRGVYASGSNIYAATYGGGLSISTDGGDTWTNKTTADGLGNNCVYGVYAAGSNIYAATYGGLSISTDGGDTWTNKTTTTGLGSNDIRSVYGYGSNIYAATWAGGLSISPDGGDTWTNKTTTHGLGHNNVYGVYTEGLNIYVATWGGGLSISTDGGDTWTNRTIAHGLGNNLVYGVYAEGSSIYAATYGGGLSISTDGGATWTNKTTSNGLGNSTVYSVYAARSNIYAATNGGGLSISTDGGATWTNKTTTNGLGNNYVHGVYVDGTTIYAATEGGLSVATAKNISLLKGLFNYIFTRNSAEDVLYRSQRDNKDVAKIQLSETMLGLGELADTNFSDVTLETKDGGKPYINVPETNPIAQAVNADVSNNMVVTASFYDLPTDKFPVIMMNGIQITDLNGNVFPAYTNYVKNINWDSGTGTLTFGITHFTEYGVPALSGKTFDGTGAATAINAAGTNLALNVQNYSVAGTAALDTSRTVQKISGLAYETVLTDVTNNANYLYQAMVPGETYGISFEYINRGNASDTIELSALLERQNTDNFNIESGANSVNYTDSKSIAAWQVASFNILINANDAYSLDVATLNVDVLVNGAATVSYNAFANAYAATFDSDRAYGGDNFNYVIILKAEGYDLQIIDRSISVNAPVGYTGDAISLSEIVPGTKIDYAIVIKNNSLSDAVSVNIKDVIPGNCHLYYVEGETPTVNGALLWEWKGATENVAPADDAIWYEITIPGQSVVTASYSVTLD